MRRLFESGMHADALLQAAEASELIGRTADAVDRLRRAAEIAERLGYVVAERAARERLAALGRLARRDAVRDPPRRVPVRHDERRRFEAVAPPQRRRNRIRQVATAVHEPGAEPAGRGRVAGGDRSRPGT